MPYRNKMTRRLPLATLHLPLPSWVEQAHQRRRLTRAVRRAYRVWTIRFPHWGNAGFDEYFLLHDALPLLTEMMGDIQQFDPKELARQWAAAYGFGPERTRRAIIECTPVAAHFVMLLQAEFVAPPPSEGPIPPTAAA